MRQTDDRVPPIVLAETTRAALAGANTAAERGVVEHPSALPRADRGHRSNKSPPRAITFFRSGRVHDPPRLRRDAVKKMGVVSGHFLRLSTRG